MEQNLGMSLDDIITTNKKNRRGSQRRQQPRRQQAAPYQQQQQQRQKPQQQQLPKAPLKTQQPAKILVSNLGYHVSSDDAKELFSQIGPVKNVALNFNEKGKSLGTATITYSRQSDATKAVDEYHKRLLDGRPMTIELLVTAENVGSTLFASNGKGTGGKLSHQEKQGNGNVQQGNGQRANSGGRGNRGVRGGRGGGRGRGGSSRQRPVNPNAGKTPDEIAAQLDSEMDKYMNDEEMADVAPSS